MRKPQPKRVAKQKLYVAVRAHEVVFISSEKTKSEVKNEAEAYLEEQDKYFSPPVVVREITCKEEIPKGWQDGEFIWGVAVLAQWGPVDELTAEQFLDEQASVRAKEEYEEYMRLKAKFG